MRGLFHKMVLCKAFQINKQILSWSINTLNIQNYSTFYSLTMFPNQSFNSSDESADTAEEDISQPLAIAVEESTSSQPLAIATEERTERVDHRDGVPSDTPAQPTAVPHSLIVVCKYLNVAG